MLAVWSWMIHLLSIKCDKDANYRRLKSEYDKLKIANTMSPSKKYHDKLVIFPDVKRNANIDKVELTEINSTSNTINTVDVLTSNATLINTIKDRVIMLLTTSANQKKLSKDDIEKFFTTDSCTVEEFEAAIKQLKALIEKQGDAIKRLMYEEVKKAMTKMGKDCKLIAKEKRESLKKHFLQLPYFKPINIDNKSEVTTYMYVTFTTGNKLMKSEIITITRNNKKIQTMHDLEEYEKKIIKKKKTPKKKTSKKKETPKKETPKKEISKKKETSKKSKILVAIILVVVGIVILSIGTLILVKKRKTTEETLDL
ncbi:hypothetical protein ECANGB1_1740 [Enterospora canceri]|uniref:Uncharacterized protein n=1 Tax=Enterospora canceri TaxID=1081671 RepID=A0A1Y1S5L9_9MICR|nr:hypothetical protein ECANGB1_1740 [Enterospora canceri]